jgi:NAD(P)-dependent dehydrogenase (short-subunit alcohol dehydrogenase family)
MDISGSKAVVTGGARGIGRAIVDAVVAHGGRVLIADIDGDQARAVAAEVGRGAVGVQCDVSDHASVVALADVADATLGGVDLVFANAGVNVGGPLLDASPQALDWIFGVNVRGVWSTAAVFGKRLRDSGRSGHICITGSEHSLGLQHAGAGLYTATKHAVLGMAEVLRAELPATIGISILCPGLVASELHLSKRHGPLPQDDAATLAFAGAVMSRGMAADLVAAAAVEGVADGHFYIVTHPAAITAPRARWDEIAAAFAAQAPWSAAAERYEVNKVVAAVSETLAGRQAEGARR